jgi:hypothetical protein
VVDTNQYREIASGYRYLPTSVDVPGGVAFFTSSFDRLKAPLREVMMIVPDVDETVIRR